MSEVFNATGLNTDFILSVMEVRPLMFVTMVCSFELDNGSTK